MMRNRITFSNVVAVLALFVALGGSAYAAGKLSGKSIKPGSVPANRIKPGSLTSTQIKDSSLKAVKSASALNQVTYQTAATATDPNVLTPYTTTATCPAGLKVIAGGASSSNNNTGAFINDQGPSPDHLSWVVHSFSGSTASTVTATAICTGVSTTSP
jgi:hypothetical protein